MKRFTIILLIMLASAANALAGGSWQSSTASWYGPGLYGNNTACGGALTTSSWGVANKTLPCGTPITMCYRKCVQVNVIDRGPYVAGRDFDLTAPVKAALGCGDLCRVRWHVNYTK